MCKKCYEGLDDLFEDKKQIKCNSCKGDGVYRYGAVVNGKPSRQGKCFACSGKGYQNKSDIVRKNSYYNHRMRLY